VFPDGMTHHPTSRGIPRLYALGQEPNEVPDRVQVEREQAIKAVESIFASIPFLLVAAAGIAVYILSKR